MNSFFNYFQDFITNKTQVDKDPLEQISDDNKTKASPMNDYLGNINDQEKSQKGKKIIQKKIDINESNPNYNHNPYDNISLEDNNYIYNQQNNQQYNNNDTFYKSNTINENHFNNNNNNYNNYNNQNSSFNSYPDIRKAIINEDINNNNNFNNNFSNNYNNDFSSNLFFL